MTLRGRNLLPLARGRPCGVEKMKKRLPPLNVRGKSVILQPQSKKTKKT